MAQYYSTQYTQAYINNPTIKIDKGLVSGERRLAYAKITLTAALLLNDVVDFLKLPAGALVTDVIFKSGNVGGTFNLGYKANGVDSAAPAAWLSGQAANAVARTAVLAGMFKQFTAETVVSAVAATAGSAAGDIEVAVEYVIV